MLCSLHSDQRSAIRNKCFQRIILLCWWWWCRSVNFRVEESHRVFTQGSKNSGQEWEDENTGQFGVDWFENGVEQVRWWCGGGGNGKLCCGGCAHFYQDEKMKANWVDENQFIPYCIIEIHVCFQFTTLAFLENCKWYFDPDSSPEELPIGH